MTSNPRPKQRRKRLPGPYVTMALCWLCLILIGAIGADILTPYSYTTMDLKARLLAPFTDWAHPLGTDHLGRDLFSRLLQSIRMSVLIVLVGTFIGAVVGITLGAIAAHFRGFIDDMIMVLVDFQAAIPMMIIALTVLAIFGNNIAVFIFIVGLSGWDRYARIMRGLSLSIREQGYITAAQSYGERPVRIYLRHILPNAAAPLVVNMTLNFPELILLESGLSFIGLGVQPPSTSLGNMVGFGRDYLTSAWWIAVFPGLVIALTALAISIVGDWLRDVMDPTIQD